MRNFMWYVYTEHDFFFIFAFCKTIQNSRSNKRVTLHESCIVNVEHTINEHYNIFSCFMVKHQMPSDSPFNWKNKEVEKRQTLRLGNALIWEIARLSVTEFMGNQFILCEIYERKNSIQKLTFYTQIPICSHLDQAFSISIQKQNLYETFWNALRFWRFINSKYSECNTYPFTNGFVFSYWNFKNEKK